ncbi:TPA: hypothetical protein MDS32_005481 [Klebsiella pneumoniae]
MSDIEDLNPEYMFDHLKNIFNEKAEEKENEEEKLFTEKQILKLFEDKIWEDLQKIKKECNSKNLQAYCSAALKNYKRNLISLYILKIKEVEDIKLTTRSADMFFINYLGRSVGEKYLCENFGRDFKSGDKIILTDKYKSELNSIILKYREECVQNLLYIISLYRKFKNYIIYA